MGLAAARSGSPAAALVTGAGMDFQWMYQTYRSQFLIWCSDLWFKTPAEVVPKF